MTSHVHINITRCCCVCAFCFCFFCLIFGFAGVKLMEMMFNCVLSTYMCFLKLQCVEFSEPCNDNGYAKGLWELQCVHHVI